MELESHGLTWLQLGFKTQVNAFEVTIKRIIDNLNYHKYLAYQHG